MGFALIDYPRGKVWWTTHFDPATQSSGQRAVSHRDEGCCSSCCCHPLRVACSRAVKDVSRRQPLSASRRLAALKNLVDHLANLSNRTRP
jgi:hypothetical protein